MVAKILCGIAVGIFLVFLLWIIWECVLYTKHTLKITQVGAE